MSVQRGFGIQKGIYNVGIYLRLSRDDNTGSESMSIANQRQMLTDYVKSMGFNLYSEYADDGYSGVNFERPSFKRMIADAEAGRINCIVTKDLSRLGRNYVQAGYYTEEYFIEHGIRFIAIQDGIDTLEENNDIAAFHHVLNEFYPRQVSKKVRQVKTASAKQGKFIGSHAPYGYVKSVSDKHVLIADSEAADIVKRIFRLFVTGESGRHIADILNGEGIPTPSVYLGYSRQSASWGSATIIQMLRNEAYIGNMVQGKKKVLSFKTKQRFTPDKSDWIRVENTHEPLIDRDVWDEAQKRLAMNYRPRVCKRGENSLFSGVVECADCGSKLAFTTKNMSGRIYEVYRCGSYNNKGKGGCSIHSISLSTLTETVLEDLRLYARLADADEEKLLKRLVSHKDKSREHDASLLQKKLIAAQKRLADVEILAQKLFEERALGNVPDGLFKKMMNGYESERVKLESDVEEIRSELSKVREVSGDLSEWIDTVRKYVKIDLLDRDLVTRLIDRITVSEVYKVGVSRHQDIKIYYKFVGCLSQQAV